MKNKFDIFNDIKIDTDEYDEIKFDNNDEFKNKMKNKIRENKISNNKKKMAIASIGVLVGSMIIVSEPSLAYIRNIGKQIEYFFNREENTFNGYKVELNQVVEDKGIEIELKEIMLGDGELLLSLKVDDSKLDKAYLGIDDSENTWPELYEPKIQIGDLVFTNTGGAMSGEANDDNSKNMLLTCKLDNLDKNNDGEPDIEKFDLISNLDINKNYDIKIDIEKIGYTLNKDAKLKNTPEYVEESDVNGGGINADTGEYFETRNINIVGNWSFKTSINAKKLIDDIDIYNVNKKLKIKDRYTDIDVSIEEVRVSPTKIKIKHSFKVNKNINKDGRHDPKFLEFIVKGEKGEDIEVKSGIDLNYNPESIYAEGELNSNIKDMKIIPVVEDWGKKFNHTKKFNDQSITIKYKN